jgi:hypothetical protein
MFHDYTVVRCFSWVCMIVDYEVVSFASTPFPLEFRDDTVAHVACTPFHIVCIPFPLGLYECTDMNNQMLRDVLFTGLRRSFAFSAHRFTWVSMVTRLFELML